MDPPDNAPTSLPARSHDVIHVVGFVRPAIIPEPRGTRLTPADLNGAEVKSEGTIAAFANDVDVGKIVESFIDPTTGKLMCVLELDRNRPETQRFMQTIATLPPAVLEKADDEVYSFGFGLERGNIVEFAFSATRPQSPAPMALPGTESPASPAEMAKRPAWKPRRSVTI